MSLDHETILNQLVMKAFVTPNPFNTFQSLLEEYTLSNEIHTISDIKLLSKTSIGLIFELFCIKYLQLIGYTSVWLRKAVPDNIRQHLKLPKNDYGIDLIAVWNNHPVAVQCKWRKGSKGITWTKLSTFYSLCSVTGPWSGLIVMTNGTNVTRVNSVHASTFITLSNLQTLTHDQWAKMFNIQGNILGSTHSDSSVEMRAARLAKFCS